MILALKLVLTPALIAVATLVGRRFGPSISGWLVGLPFTSGPVSLFLALEQGTSFAAAAAAGSIGGVAASALFAVAYAAVARRHAWPASLAVASLAFAGAVVMLRATPLDSGLPLPLLALYAGSVAAAIIGIRLIPAPRTLEDAPEPPRWDLPVRMVVATALVIVITSAAPLIGPQLSGLLTTYPVYAGVLAVFAHAQRGGAAAAQVVRGLCYGILAFATFFLAIGALVDRAGIVPAFAAAAFGAILVQAITLTRITKGSPSRIA
ncbi:MAG: hypothetical protein M3T56_08230 [Chloroflexota bacterium]|nr:hypothetical protein [Chloroflexota bacterium]